MSILELAIGWLAPAECINCGAEGNALCLSCRKLHITPYGQRCFGCNKLSALSKTCSSCRKLGAPSHVFVTTSYDGVAKEIIRSYKFGQQRHVAKPISELMQALVTSHIGNLKAVNYLVVPVPTATKRVRQRGFDHSVLLARNLSLALHTDLVLGLGRLGQGRQIGANRLQRMSQASGLYFVKHPQSIAGRNILLVDDVVTTGATLNAASSVLRKAGARHVHAAVFAKKL